MPRHFIAATYGWRGFLLPCPFKYLTGIDCPGCGFQRSVLALLHGDWSSSFSLYPSTLPLLLATLHTLACNWVKLDTHNEIIKKGIYIITGSCILISYLFKLRSLYAIPS